MLRRIILFFAVSFSLVFFTAFTASAQIKLQSLARYSEQYGLMHLDSADSTLTSLDTVSVGLPFFDDFSVYEGVPDTNFWMPSGGAFANKGMGIAPPSLGVMSFDGLDEFGQPYNFEDPTQVGNSDVLTSRKIDLDTLSNTDGVFLSFYWQVQGRGERPDATDFLELEFKVNDSTWERQWIRYGNEAEQEAFRQEIIGIRNDFLKKDFQFRFRVRTRLSGNFDSWNIDYVYLNKDRTAADLIRLDIACSEKPESFLGEYSAVPIDHYRNNPSRFKKDTVTATLNNLNDVFNVISYEYVFENADTDEQIAVLFDSSEILREEIFFQYELKGTPDTLAIDPELTELRVRQEFQVKTNETDSIVPGVNFRNNDTISTVATLKDYYAYDDGDAEFAAGINQRFGKLAYRFVTSEPDVLTDIDINFVPVGFDASGQTFNVYIWKSLDFSDVNAQDSVLQAQNEVMFYPDTINGFRRIKLLRPVEVSDTFFIGFEQLYEEMLTVGFDRNSDSGGEIFFNVTNKWEQNTRLEGSLMMRPVFQNNPLSTENDPVSVAKVYDVTVFPNPAQDRITLRGEVSEVQLFDMQGRSLLQRSLRSFDNEHQVTLPAGVPDGLYLLHMTNRKGEQVSKKLIIQR